MAVSKTKVAADLIIGIDLGMTFTGMFDLSSSTPK